jgi:hypothetical protein
MYYIYSIIDHTDTIQFRYAFWYVHIMFICQPSISFFTALVAVRYRAIIESKTPLSGGEYSSTLLWTHKVAILEFTDIRQDY